jgi:hypothetical protein
MVHQDRSPICLAGSHRIRSRNGTELGLSNWLDTELSFGVGIGITTMSMDFGLSNGLSCGVMVVLVHLILAGSVEPLRFAERIHWTWRGLFRLQHLRTSLSIAGTLFLFCGLIYGLIYGRTAG